MPGLIMHVVESVTNIVFNEVAKKLNTFCEKEREQRQWYTHTE